MLVLLFALWWAAAARADSDVGGALVYMMDWTYDDIAKECAFLGKHGFAGVVISPPTENVVVANRPWKERYQVISYKLETRSGDIVDLAVMVKDCHHHNVRVFADIVLNNLASSKLESAVGTGGSVAIPKNYDYPEFNIKSGHFNGQCPIQIYQDAGQVRGCELADLADLHQANPYVREKQVELLNDLVALGVAGFIVDQAKFMWPWDLAVLQTRTYDIRWTDGPTRPIMLYDVNDPAVRQGPVEAVKWDEYSDLGRVTDYKYGTTMGQYFLQNVNFVELINNGELYNRWIPSKHAFVFLTNVYTHWKKDPMLLKYNDKPELYKLASALMLAFNYGQPLVLSSYSSLITDEFGGPPSDSEDNILSPGEQCLGGWNCEHRLPEVYRMAYFHRECRDEPVTNVQGGAKGQFAFARGKKGFVAFNAENEIWSQTFTTGLKEGKYCEVITGGLKDSLECADESSVVTVDATGSFLLEVPPMSVRAIHSWNKIGFASHGVERVSALKKATRFLKKLAGMVIFSGGKGAKPEAALTAAPPSNA